MGGKSSKEEESDNVMDLKLDSTDTMNEASSVFNKKSRIAFGHKTIMVNKGSMRFQKHQKVRNQFQATVNANSNYKNQVKCPVGEDRMEWVGMHAFVFYDIAENVFLSCQSENLCDDVNCPIMTAGPKYSFLWADGDQYKNPTNLPANQYISLAFDWIFLQLSDEQLFPQDDKPPVDPKRSDKVLLRVYKLLFRIWAHMYHSHYAQMGRMGFDAPFSSGFKHFITFIVRNQVLEYQQLTPLSSAIQEALKISLKK